MPKEIHFHACVFYAIAASDRLPINRNTGKVVVSYFFPFYYSAYFFLWYIYYQKCLNFVNKTNFCGKIQTYVTGKVGTQNEKKRLEIMTLVVPIYSSTHQNFRLTLEKKAWNIIYCSTFTGGNQNQIHLSFLGLQIFRISCMIDQWFFCCRLIIMRSS